MNSIKINNIKYDYKLFDTNELIEMIRKKLKFIESLEKTIQNYRNNKKFVITDLIREYINSEPKSLTKYSIIYKKNIIISTCRFFYTKIYCYFSLVYTHPDYRGQKICYNHIKKIINLYKDTIKIYYLYVDKDNIPAIKCYENLNFKIIKSYDDRNEYVMQLKI